MGIDLLLEGFASNLHPRDWHGRFRVGDVVRVKPPKAKGSDGLEVVGRIQRFTSNDTAIVSPEHGGAHIEAKPNEISFHSPNSHRSMLKRRSSLDPAKPPAETHAEYASDRLAIDQEAHRRAEAIGSQPRNPAAREPAPAERRAAQTAARAGQGRGTAVHSSGKLITPAQKRRLSSVVRDITVNARQDKPHMDAAISRALRDSGHTMGKTPGWMDKLHTNHASVLIKELERLAKHGPGEDAKPFEARESDVTMLLEGFTQPTTKAPAGAPRPSLASTSGTVSPWSAASHPRGLGGKFAYTTGGKRASRAVPTGGRYLAVGSKGALIKAIQRQLGIKQDGVYGPQTRAAVVRYQRQHGLTVDGVVGAQTLAALRGNHNAKSIKPGPITSRTATIKTYQTAAQRRAAQKAAKHAAQAKAQQTFAPVRLGGGAVV